MESPAWSCAHCQLPMHRGEYGLIVTWNCTPCRFTWVTRTSLISVLEKTGLDRLTTHLASAPGSSRKLVCPACHTSSFRTLEIERAAIDVCDTCQGIVFDPGELQTVLQQSYWAQIPSQKTFMATDLVLSTLELFVRGLI